MSILKPWARLSPSSRTLVAICTVLLPMMMVFVSLAMVNMRHVALRSAQQDEANLDIAIAEQTSRSIQGIDLVLQNMQKDIVTRGITTPEEFLGAFGGVGTYHALTQVGAGVPQVQSFSVVGADGYLLNSSVAWPLPRIELSDREYFQYLKAHDDKGVYVSRPMQARGDGAWTVFIIRRVDSPSGQFLGLVLGAINLDYFADFYRSLVAHNGLTVTLLTRSADIVASYPVVPHIAAAVRAPHTPYMQWNRIVASGHPGFYEAPGIISPGMHLNQVVPLQDYPFVVSVGVSEDRVLADWRQESWIAAGGTAIAVLCIGLVLRALTLQLQRLEESEANLARQNTALIKAEAAITYRANHDDLTGLNNRSAFRHRLGQAIDHADRHKHTMAVLYLDLDRFKIANDTRGHDFGDKLLVQLAARLCRMVEPTDIVARTGGDEFAVLRPTIADGTEMTQLAEMLLEGIREPFMIDGVVCRIGSSIGIACYPDHGTNEGELLRNADMALYQAKSCGGDAWRIFDESMNASQQEIFTIEQGLRQALQLQQFELNYQPIVDTGTGDIVACEALLRWRHPERGLIPPMDFIALAESLGLIINIGYWVFETACAEAASWPAPLTVAVNLSPIQFRDENLCDKIADILHRTGLAPSRLTLEITEGVLLEDSRLIGGIMERLGQLGVRISLDDFGTGHSGLGYLRRFPLHGIKIDKIFVHGLEHQPQARAIVSGLLMIAAALNLNVVAEGIENKQQMETLHRLGCWLGQGYFTGRPVSADEMRKMLTAKPRVVAQ